MTINTAHYTYRVSWSAEDQEFVATCVELPSLSWLEPTQALALDGILRLVDEVVADLTKSGEAAPEPLAERSYSGSFRLRVPPALHRDLVLHAAEEHVSLNRYLNDRLARCIGEPVDANVLEYV